MFLRIRQYDIFLVWFDVSVFSCVHNLLNLLQVFVKVTEQNMALWLGKK